MRYLLKGKSHGVAVRAGVNGSATLLDRKAAGIVVGRQVNEWIRPADNVLAGLIFTPPGGVTPEGTSTPARDASVSVAVYAVGPDGLPPPGVPPLAAFRWPLPVGPRVVPFPFRIPFKVPVAVDTQLWKRATRVESLGDLDRDQIVRLVNELYAALAAGNGPAVWDLLRLRYEDEAMVEGFAVDDMRAVVSQQSAVFRRFGNRYTPLEAGRATLTPVADGYLWLVTRGALDPAIVFENDQMRLAMEVYVAKVDGRWVVARG